MRATMMKFTTKAQRLEGDRRHSSPVSHFASSCLRGETAPGRWVADFLSEFSSLFFAFPLLAWTVMKTSSSPGGPRLTATRKSLVERLTNWEDRRNWEEFFETYWRLIYGVARQSGLSDAEAQDVVQETVITVAKNITKYEREVGSFKGWLLHITRWRIADQFRKRAPQQARRERADSRRGT